MGSSCSSGQAHKDKDSSSQKSEESPSYQVPCKNKPPPDLRPGGLQSGVVLEAATVEEVSRKSTSPTVQLNTPGSSGAKPHKGFRTVAMSSFSTDSVSPGSPPGILSPRELNKSSLPPLVRSLSDNNQNLLLGATAITKIGTKCRKIVIYVCAADSQDCCVEKGALHNTIYPILREKAKNRGYELHIIDLHWKTELEKQQDHEFPELCLGELSRQSEVAYIIPVLFLSNSLGTPLLPKTIETQDFEMALSKAGNKDLLKKWYHHDSHAQPPCYRLQPIARHIPGFKEQCKEEKEKALADWRSEIDRILNVLLAAFPQELRDTYLTTVVEQEVHNTVLMSQELARRCLWLCRVFTHQTEDTKSNNSSPSEAELKRRLETLQKDLKAQLCEHHVLRLTVRWLENGLNLSNPEHAQYVAEVVLNLNKQLTNIIDSIIEEDQSKAVIKPIQGIESNLFLELCAQTHFTQRAAQCSINRDGVLQQIQSYVLGERHEGKTMVLYGNRGSGKTTLLARAAQCCHLWQLDCVVVIRFTNISIQSCTLEQILRTIILQCSILGNEQLWIKHSLSSYSSHFMEVLTAASLHRTIIIIIDAIDQLKQYGVCGFNWLPSKLPPNVKILLSLTDNSTHLNQLQEKFGTDGGHFIKIPDLDKAEAESILLTAVQEYNHSVNSHVQECVVTSVKTCTLPLYVKVLAWQTSWCDPENIIEPQGDVDKQMSVMFSQLEAMLGSEQVSLAMALLSCAKFGLTDSEMIDLLAHIDSFHSRDTYVIWAPACLFWAHFTKQLIPFLQWTDAGGTGVLHWRDVTLQKIVDERYKDSMPWARKTLVKYFKGELWSTQTESFTARLLKQHNKVNESYNVRKLEELPYHVYHSTGSLKMYLEDYNWLFDKICGTSPYQVLEDLTLEEIKQKDKNQDLMWLRDFLERNARALAYDGQQFFAKLVQHPGSCQLRDKWKNVIEYPPVLSLIALTNQSVAEHDNNIEENQCYFDMVVRLPNNSNFVVTIATSKEEIAVWDVHKCCRVRTLTGVPQPINLQMIDDLRCVVLCKRELRTYDLNSGQLITILKGVMNQKMPYFGLHDKCHLVALSRNRMYVNLMNLNTGDLVTTFKAGEDRFLNSLLVSGDGRVLVCGDETQKPFPLLVWNLASRKLLYDLRIPHHDFVTTLAAITYEGHYVCCVAKEVDEPSPNFIVVYDLQSGTLFKKWKPAVDTVSLDISSKDGCVLSGLEDGRILVWDLITGNCRWRLSGHCAAVTCLKLDPFGGACLSLDSECRDRSIRLWNLNTGEQSAVYSPNSNITSSEIIAGGSLIVLAMKGSNQLTILQLNNTNENTANDQPVYGLSENNGLIFNLVER